MSLTSHMPWRLTLDPIADAGTTGVAAVTEGRSFGGFEMDRALPHRRYPPNRGPYAAATFCARESKTVGNEANRSYLLDDEARG